MTGSSASGSRRAEITSPRATVAVVTAGAIPYYIERHSIDLLGKTDPFVARLPMRRAPGWAGVTGYYPGHLKWDYRYSIGELKPDVVAQLWGDPREAAPYLDRRYVGVTAVFNRQVKTLYLRRASPNIHWQKVGGLQISPR